MRVYLAVSGLLAASTSVADSLNITDFCCTEHSNIQLDGDSSTTSSVNSKEECMELCLNEGKCLASQHQAGAGTCVWHSQTPKQTAVSNADLTTFLCRTRALQVCERKEQTQVLSLSKFDTLRAHTPDSSTYGEESTATASLDACHSACSTTYGGRLTAVTHWTSVGCWCYIDHLPIYVPNAEMSAYICKNRVVSCKAKNARRKTPADKACTKHPNLRLWPRYVGAAVPDYMEIVAASDAGACELICHGRSGCLAANHYDGECALIAENADFELGQAWGQTGYTAIICG